MTTPLSVAFVEVTAAEQAYFAAHTPSEWRVSYCATTLSSIGDAVNDAEVLSIFVHSRVDAKTLDGLPRLRLLVTRSTGFDHIDIAACTARNVLVCNVPDYGANTVAEHAFALLLTIARKTIGAVAQVRAGQFSAAGLRGVDIAGKTLGIVGTGRIGSHAARIGHGFGLRVLATDPYPNERLVAQHLVQYVPLPTLLQQSDFITLHCPATPETHHLIDARAFAQMKHGVILINTARGNVIDAGALVRAIDSGVVAGAGLDVLESENCFHYPPCPTDSDVVRNNGVLIAHDRVVVTPHIAFNTAEAMERLLATSVENIAQFLAGRPQHLVT